MTFLNPQAFWGLSLLIIPVLIHLFSFRRYKKVLFSNLAFLAEVKQQKQSSSRIKKILVLFCRLLLIFFLIAAFAQPTRNNQLLVNKRNEGLIYFDNSFSNQQVDEGGEPVLFRSYNTFIELLDKQNTFEYKVLSHNGLVEFARNPEPSELHEFSSKRLSISEIQDKADLYAINEILIFSDFQRNSFNLNSIEEDTSNVYQLYQSIPKQQNNLFVDTLYSINQMSYSEAYSIHIRIKNSGEMHVEDALIRLVKDGRQLVSKSFNIMTNGAVEIEFDLEETNNVYGAYHIELSDVPVVFDNSFSFYIGRPEISKILLLEDKEKSITGNYLQTLFTNGNYFQLDRAKINSTSINKLLDADLIILSEIHTIPDWLIKQIDGIKGNILVIPNNDIDLNSYNQLSSIRLTSNGQSKLSPINSKVLTHSFLNGVLDNNELEVVSMPNFMPVYGVQGYYENIMETNEGNTVLAQVGNERLYLTTAPLNDEYSDLQKHALFVPLMYKIAQNNIQSPTYHRLNDSFIEIESDSIIGGETILKLSSNESSFYPSYRYISKGLIFEIPDEMTEPGIYYLLDQVDTLGVYAFNFNKVESDIQCYSMEELSDLAKANDHVSYQPLGNRVLSNATVNIKPEPNSLWKYALLLALLFILIESILLRFLK